MVSTIGFQMIIAELLGTFVDTVPLGWELWLADILIEVASLIVAVIIKSIPVATSDHTLQHYDCYQPLPFRPELA